MKKQQGNVLFLILVAVVLFAALSYAVTQSSRSGGGVDSETDQLNMAAYGSYISSVRFGYQRLRLKGVSPDDMTFSKASSDACIANAERCLFHPDGGGVVFRPLSDFVKGSAGLDGYIAVSQSIEDVGTAAPDVMYFEEDISLETCRAFNIFMGLPPDPIREDTMDNSIDGMGGATEFCYQEDFFGWYAIVIVVDAL